MLDSLDKELEKRGHQFVRYADDFIILVRSQRTGARVLKSVTHYLATKLKLVVNEQKSQVVKMSQSQFLGFTFSRGQIQWHAKTVRILKQKIRRLTNRNWGVSMGSQLFKLRQYLQGWINYFWYCKCLSILCRTRSVDPPTSSHVLLATVAQTTNEGAKPTKARSQSSNSGLLRYNKQRTMEKLENVGDTASTE